MKRPFDRPTCSRRLAVLALTAVLLLTGAAQSQAGWGFSVGAGFGYRSHFHRGFYPRFGGFHGGWGFGPGLGWCPPVYSTSIVYSRPAVAYTVPATTVTYAAPTVVNSTIRTEPAPAAQQVVYQTPAATTRNEPAPVSQQAAIHAAVHGKPTSAADNRSPWKKLSTGDYQEASETFASELADNPTKGLPKVGFALASALNNNYDTAIYTMRRAFLFDPAGASYVPADSALAGKIHELAVHYHKMAEKVPDDVDAMYMLAATSLLINDFNAAKPAIQNVKALGDTTKSALNLEKMILAKAPEKAETVPVAKPEAPESEAKE